MNHYLDAYDRPTQTVHVSVVRSLEESLRTITAQSDALEAEVERLKAQPTAAQERAAIVAWMRSGVEPRDVFGDIDLAAAAGDIEEGDHWPTEGAKCRHCLRTLQAHEQDFCDACSQLEGGTP
jgi:hypothetical protein